MSPYEVIECVISQVIDVARYILPFWFRGWGWGTFAGILHELDKILGFPAASVFEVLFAIIEVAESGITETDCAKQ